MVLLIFVSKYPIIPIEIVWITIPGRTSFGPGENITVDKFKMVEKAEYFLHDLGFKQVRVRMHRDLARIEVGGGQRPLLAAEAVMDKIAAHYKLAELPCISGNSV